MIKKIIDNDQLLALILPQDYSMDYGVHFLTVDDLSQQLAYIHHPAGKTVQPHFHNLIPRKISYTQETLFIKTGKLRVDFYGENQTYVQSCTLGPGDLILLIAGGHGFKILEDAEIYEVKQGPYVGEADKTRFKGVSNYE